MKSFSCMVKQNCQDCVTKVHGQGFDVVVVVAAVFCLEKLFNK